MHRDASEGNKKYRFVIQPTWDANNCIVRVLQVIPVFEGTATASMLERGGHVESDIHHLNYLVAWEKELVEEALVFFRERLSVASASGRHSFQIGVPLSLTTALSEGYSKWLYGLVSVYGIEPQQLVLHVWASELHGSREAEEIFRILGRAGFKICADGYLADGPNFEMLSNPDIQFINCDGLIPEGAGESQLAMRFLRGLIALASQLDKTVIVSGIDSTDELELVKGLDDVWYQGKLAGGYLAPDELHSYIDKFALHQ